VRARVPVDCDRGSDRDLVNLQDEPDLPDRVGVPDHVLWQEVDGRVVLLDADAAQYHALDDIGSRMWKLIVDDADLTSVRDELLATYEVRSDVLTRDLIRFVGELVSTGLLHELGAGGS